MPMGLRTLVGDMGSSLSGGQPQRIGAVVDGHDDYSGTLLQVIPEPPSPPKPRIIDILARPIMWIPDIYSWKGLDQEPADFEWGEDDTHPAGRLKARLSHGATDQRR